MGHQKFSINKICWIHWHHLNHNMVETSSNMVHNLRQSHSPFYTFTQHIPANPHHLILLPSSPKVYCHSQRNTKRLPHPHRLPHRTNEHIQPLLATLPLIPPHKLPHNLLHAPLQLPLQDPDPIPPLHLLDPAPKTR